MSDTRRFSARAAAAVLVTALSGCAWIGGDAALPTSPFVAPASETALRYEAQITGAPSAAVEDLLTDALSLTRRQAAGAQSLALLRRRAEQDAETAQRALRSQGYYAATVATDVVAPAVEDAPAVARLAIEPGAPFTIAAHRFALDGPAARDAGVDLTDAAAEAGAPARAVDVLSAEAAAIAALRARGYVWARTAGRRATADLEAETLTVQTALVSGPRARFGPLRIEGAETVRESYLKSYAGWEAGAVADPALITALQRDLAATNLFSAASVALPETPPEGADPEVTVPITARVEERAPRTASFGARIDTDGGPEARVSVEHRNLFGAGERGEIALQGGAEEQLAELSFRKPQFLRPGQDLTAGFGVRRAEDDAFDELAATLQAGLERRLSERWTVGAGGLAEIARIEDSGEETDSLLLGAPAFARYDGSDDLLDPTEGARVSVTATPFVSLVDDQSAPALAVDARASAYRALDVDRRHVLAVRGRLGAIGADALDDIPANRRLYAGGGGSVRGFADRFVGPLDAAGDPEGGRLAAEAGVEIRSRIWGPVGGVAFVEAGGVTRDLEADFEGGLLTAAGVGLRYFSPVGPIRADIAAPIDPRSQDERFQVYFSIGQAF